MKLSANELNWINERMKIYQLKQGAIYHEILDHIISAIEQKRGAGDNRNIETLFQQVVDGHFGGQTGIADLAVKQEEAYKQSVQNRWMQSFKYYLTWPMLGFIVIALFLSFKLPNARQVKGVLLVVYILLISFPGMYAYFSLRGRVLKSVIGEQRFLKTHLVRIVSTPSSLLGFLSFYTFYYPWIYIDYLSPVIFMAVIILFVLVDLASVHFCRQFTVVNPTTN